MGVVYSSLREKDEIRLLRLLPGTGSEPVRCVIFHARLGESPTYDALSYMWGQDQPGKKVNLQVDDGRTLEVRQNLGDALRYLRLKTQERILWVDAICINQADDTERGHQVAQMGIIYSQATTVRVWLGLSDDHSVKAFRYLSNAETVRRMKEGFIALHEWAAVARLCMREYWQRLWVIQEFVLAARVEVHCGERVLDGDLFSNALFAFEEGLHKFERTNNPRRAGAAVSAKIVNSAAMKICRQRRANTESGPATELASLLSLLWMHKDAECVDIRDKIFGTHSFAPECCRSCIPVDYTCSAYTLCRRVLEHDILCHSGGRRNGGREGVVRRSLDLHGLIVEGAQRQLHSKNRFELGNPRHREEDSTVMLTSQIPSPIMVLGHEMGRVAFVTPPLKSLCMEETPLVIPRAMISTFEAMKFGSEDAEDPFLTYRITTALGLIWRSKEMDILSGDISYSSRNMALVDINHLEEHAASSAYGFQNFLNFCCEFLRASDFLDSNTAYEDCVICLARVGLSWRIGFAPVGTTLGDSVCTFQDTNLIAIVRKLGGDNTMVGQGSVVENLTPIATRSHICDVVNIQLDLSTLQMFSKVAPQCKLEDYRVVLKIPPKARKEQVRSISIIIPGTRPRRLKGIRQLTHVLRAPSMLGESLAIPPHQEDGEWRWSDAGKEPPAYSKIPPEDCALEASKPRQMCAEAAVAKFHCPRCNMSFDTTRENLHHAANWSHQQCQECSRWTSWQSDCQPRTTSVTPLCTLCRLDEPMGHLDLSEQTHEKVRTSWWKMDAMSASSEDSVRESMTFSEAMSSTATTVSDCQSMALDDLQTGFAESKMSSSNK